MDSDHWRELLLDWFRDMLTLGDNESLREIPRKLAKSGWLGYPGAADEQLATVERRLGAGLPPSYRAFLAVINGCWLLTGHSLPYRFWSTEEVEWFAVRHQDWIDAWLDGYTFSGPPRPVPDDEYLVYGPKQRGGVRTEYFQTALEVSERGDNDSIYLLNPQIVTPEGEWEAWAFDHEEIIRYRSFWDMLQAQHKRFLRVLVLMCRQRS